MEGPRRVALSLLHAWPLAEQLRSHTVPPSESRILAHKRAPSPSRFPVNVTMPPPISELRGLCWSFWLFSVSCPARYLSALPLTVGLTV